jgi:ribonuclease P protein component
VRPPAGPRPFGKARRLLKGEQFKQVFQRCYRSHDTYFTFCAHYNAASPGRLGLAISRRHARHAVQRNRLKRIVRERFRLAGDELQGIDVVVLNKPAATDADNASLHASVEAHLRRIVAKRGELRGRIPHNTAP